MCVMFMMLGRWMDTHMTEPLVPEHGLVKVEVVTEKL
jgi:hypothetical protein